MSTLSFILTDAMVRRKACDAVMKAEKGWLVTLSDLKSREQEKRYHAMLNDVSKQCEHLNRRLDPVTWKRLCVDQFRKDTKDDPQLRDYWARNGVTFIPSLDGTAVVALGEQTRRFPKYVANAFIAWLEAFGAERDVQWSDPTQPPLESYSEDVRAR